MPLKLHKKLLKPHMLTTTQYALATTWQRPRNAHKKTTFGTICQQPLNMPYQQPGNALETTQNTFETSQQCLITT